MRYERCKITRDVNTVYNRAVSEWELPVLQYVFAEGNVVRTGQFEEVNGDYPDPVQEFNRLGNRYGSDPDGKPFVETVFGQGRIGIRELAKLISDTKAADEARRGGAKAGKGQKRRTPAEVDTLLG